MTAGGGWGSARDGAGPRRPRPVDPFFRGPAKLILLWLPRMSSDKISVVARVVVVKPARSFRDKDEWKEVLKALQQDGKLMYEEASDSIRLPAPAPPPAEEE